MASAGVTELARNVTRVNQANMIFERLAKKRKELQFMTPPMGCKIFPRKARKHYASKAPARDDVLTTAITEIG
jgi:hypothetical protein